MLFFIDILFATDEWFATCENLLNPTPPIFIPDLFCDQGKVMDGWETRRKRIAGHDWCIIKLSSGLDDERTGRVHDRSFTLSTFHLDTAYFTGNQAPRVSIEGMKVTRPYNEDDNAPEHDNEDYLYTWLPGASTRLSRSGKGIRGTGQSPSTVSHALEACQEVARKTIPNNPNGDWITILPMTTLKPGYEESRYHTFEVLEDVKRKIAEVGGITHLRLNYYPDGGVARLNVYGSLFSTDVVEEKELANSTLNDGSNAPIVHPHSSSDPAPSTLPHPFPELSSEVHGGLGLACSNRHYGVPQNLLRQYPGKDMGDGWETARHPYRPATVSKDSITGLQITPLNDWCVIKLGLGGAKQNEGISRIIVDTRHFKGNFPESVNIDGCYANHKRVSDDEVCKSAGEDDTKQSSSSIKWFPLLKRTLLKADAEHEFVSESEHLVNERRGVSHIRISISPDGGLSRVRVYGSPIQKPVEHINSHL